MSKYDLPVYVVHYTKLLKRKKYIENVLKEYFIKFKFIKKYDKEDLYLDQNEFSYEKTQSDLKIKLKNYGRVKRLSIENYQMQKFHVF